MNVSSFKSDMTQVVNSGPGEPAESCSNPNQTHQASQGVRVTIGLKQ